MLYIILKKFFSSEIKIYIGVYYYYLYASIQFEIYNLFLSVTSYNDLSR